MNTIFEKHNGEKRNNNQVTMWWGQTVASDADAVINALKLLSVWSNILSESM